jgi:hypothetical protein
VRLTHEQTRGLRDVLDDPLLAGCEVTLAKGPRLKGGRDLQVLGPQDEWLIHPDGQVSFANDGRWIDYEERKERWTT